LPAQRVAYSTAGTIFDQGNLPHALLLPITPVPAVACFVSRPPSTPARSGRLRLARTGIHLLAGAAIAVALAWGLAAWGPARPRTGLEPLDGHPETAAWLDGLDADLAAQPGWVITAHGPGLRRDFLTATNISGRWAGHAEAVRVRAGWPALALEGAGLLERDAIAVHWHAAIDVDPSPPHDIGRRFAPRVLPLRPLWRGLLLDALVWAALVGLLTVGPRSFIRARRRRRGRCPACGYPLGPSPRCPECGAGAPSRIERDDVRSPDRGNA
jgi:hypothetical protein